MGAGYLPVSCAAAPPVFCPGGSPILNKIFILFNYLWTSKASPLFSLLAQYRPDRLADIGSLDKLQVFKGTQILPVALRDDAPAEPQAVDF